MNVISHLIRPNSIIIVGFSGGPDSVALLDWLEKQRSTLSLNLIAAHLDHGWRPQSAQDAAWCQEWCNKRNITIIVNHANDYMNQCDRNGSLEAFGRKTRKIFFESLAKQYNADSIMLAHHQDDQIETFFIKLARGSSIYGLSGIQTINGMYTRPLLHTTKHDILQYLKSQNISYLTDETNNSDLFLRNKIRHKITSQLSSIDARFNPKIIEMMSYLHSLKKDIDTILNNYPDLYNPNNKSRINRTLFNTLPTTLQMHLLNNLIERYSSGIVPHKKLLLEIIRFLSLGRKKEHLFSLNYVIVIDQNEFFIAKI